MVDLSATDYLYQQLELNLHTTKLAHLRKLPLETKMRDYLQDKDTHQKDLETRITMETTGKAELRTSNG